MNAIESIKYRKSLEQGGVPPGDALAHSDALGEVLESLTVNLATKDWVHAHLMELKFDLLKWMITLFVAQVSIQAGLLFAAICYLSR
jgi:hypothetical protein